jgi:VanZ family protein
MSEPLWRRKWAWIVWLSFVVIWTALLCSPIPRSAERVVGDLDISRREVAAKVVHVCGYALLALLTGWLRVPWRFRVPLMFLVMAHAAATELIQRQVAGRSGQLTDVGLDHVGVLFGLLLSWKWWSADP